MNLAGTRRAVMSHGATVAALWAAVLLVRAAGACQGCEGGSQVKRKSSGNRPPLWWGLEV